MPDRLPERAQKVRTRRDSFAKFVSETARSSEHAAKVLYCGRHGGTDAGSVKGMTMSIRTLPVAVTAALLILGSVGVAAEAPPPKMEMHETTADNQIEIALSMSDHEAAAQRFDAEAADFDKQAERHERWARLYSSGAAKAPKADAASLATHCAHIAKSLRDSAAEAREMARLHRDVAHHVVQ